VKRAVLIGAVALAAAAPAAASAATPQLHAHRGGSWVDGKAKYAENTLPAFRAAARSGFVLEFDIGVTADGVPVVLHDNSLDRTTACTGPLNAVTLEALKACPNDIVGSPGGSLGGKRSSKTTPVPTLVEVLALAKREKATVNAELKDFDADDSRVKKAIDVLVANPLPQGKLIVQSFFPFNLDLVKARLPNVPRSRLTLQSGDDQGLEAAKRAGDTWVSPQWPVSEKYMRRAHAAGLKVVPYTLNTKTAVRNAAALKVDALITDDPSSARRWLKKK
jgi:glycerophosphoryl diester phosphodiesterase